MNIIVTCFEPFNNNIINYSNEILNLIDNNYDEVKINKFVLPVLYYKSFNILKNQIIKFNPSLILMLGEARSYSKFGFESIGLNLVGSNLDNDNFNPNTDRLINNNIDGIFSNLDYNFFKESCKKYNILSFKSYYAGDFVCNSLLYQTLLFIKNNFLNIKCGFIHIPIIDNYNYDNLKESFNNYLKLELNKIKKLL